MINQTGLYNALHSEFDFEDLAFQSVFNHDICGSLEENDFFSQSETISSVGKNSLEMLSPQKLNPKALRRKTITNFLRKSDENSNPQELTSRHVAGIMYDSSVLDRKDLKTTKASIDNNIKRPMFIKLTPDMKQIGPVTIRIKKT